MLTWLFDLDNTLHDASHAIFPAINQNMNRFIAQVLGTPGQPASAADVDAARIGYWKRYGATLLGMVKHHDVRQEDFLHAAHQFDDLASMIRTEPGLRALLRRLPGRKILLTNAPARYANAVMRQLGLQRHFDRSVSIESMRVHRQLRPKPSRAMLRQLLARDKLQAHRCVLVEDTPVNLKAAHRLGVRTVWLTRYVQARLPGAASSFIKRPPFVDVKVKSLKQLSGQLHRLR